MPPVQNRGRLINFISGINGVASGGQATINLPVNQRYHRIILHCTSGATVADAVTDVIETVKIIVNGVVVRDISPAHMLRLAMAEGYIPKLGELPILFTNPLGNNALIEPDDQNSWDLAGQASFTIQIGLKVIATPGITGIIEYDFLRNAVSNGKGGASPFLMPIGHHQNSMPVVVGRNDITTIPFDFPIRRLWFSGSSAGQISQVEIIADGIKWFEATQAQLVAAYRQNGFKFSQVDYTPFQGAGPADLLVNPLVETPLYFDAAYISDPDGRFWRALKAKQALVVRVTSAAAQTLTVVSETLPGSFAG